MLIMNLFQLLLPTFVLLSVNFRSATAYCDQTSFTGANGTISSPNYPLQYPALLTCSYTISIPEGSSMYIRFVAFNTERCCDRLTISCDSGLPFEPRVLAGESYLSTLLIPSCSRAKLLFTTDGSGELTGFSLVYSAVPGQKIIEGFNVRPSNIFLQTTAGNTFTLKCTSTSGFLPWWMFQPKEAHFNFTVTNGFCNLSGTFGFRSHFFSESLGPGSCNLISSANPYIWRDSMGSFICNYGSSASTAAIVAAFSPEFQFSKPLGRAAETITDLELTADDEVQYLCSPDLGNFHDSDLSVTWMFLSTEQRSSIAQIGVSRIYWSDDKENVLSNSTSGRSAITVKAQTVSGVHVFPNYTCNIEVKFFTNITFMDKTAPRVMSFSTGTARIPFGPEKKTMSIVGDDDGKVILGGILSCHAHAYPAATYHWTDESTGQLVNGLTITVTHSGQYTCAASNSFNQKLHQESKAITVEVVNVSSGKLNLPVSESLNSKTIALVAVVGVVILSINVIFTLGLFLRFKRSTEQNRYSENKISRVEPSSKGKTNNGPTDDGQPDDGYGKNMRYHRMSSLNSQDSE